MKETLTLLERCQRNIWDDRLKKHDGTKIVISLSKEELTEAIANTLKQAAEALEGMKKPTNGFIEIEIGTGQKMKVPAHSNEAVAFNQALTDAQRLLVGEDN